MQTKMKMQAKMKMHSPPHSLISTDCFKLRPAYPSLIIVSHPSLTRPHPLHKARVTTGVSHGSLVLAGCTISFAHPMPTAMLSSRYPRRIARCIASSPMSVTLSATSRFAANPVILLIPSQFVSAWNPPRHAPSHCLLNPSLPAVYSTSSILPRHNNVAPSSFFTPSALSISLLGPSINLYGAINVGRLLPPKQRSGIFPLLACAPIPSTLTTRGPFIQ